MSLGFILAAGVLIAVFILWLIGGFTLPIAYGCIAALALAMLLGGVPVKWPTRE